MNKHILVGRLTADPEIQYTSSNIALCRFSIAVDRRFKDATGERISDFFNCVVWRAGAENFVKHAFKGQQVAIVGETHIERYDNKDGIKMTGISVQVDEYKFLSWRDVEEKEVKPYNDIPTPQESDLPF